MDGPAQLDCPKCHHVLEYTIDAPKYCRQCDKPFAETIVTEDDSVVTTGIPAPTDLQQNREVAVKVLDAKLTSSEDEPAKPKDFQLAIDDVFQEAVLKMLAKQPQNRHSTPAELMEDLQRIGKNHNLEID